jgi:hypothetical protein
MMTSNQTRPITHIIPGIIPSIIVHLIRQVPEYVEIA